MRTAMYHRTLQHFTLSPEIKTQHSGICISDFSHKKAYNSHQHTTKNGIWLVCINIFCVYFQHACIAVAFVFWMGISKKWQNDDNRMPHTKFNATAMHSIANHNVWSIRVQFKSLSKNMKCGGTLIKMDKFEKSTYVIARMLCFLVCII